MNISKDYSIPKPVDFIIRRIMNNGGEAYIVGGAVRDLILNKPINDWDVATSFKPEEIEILFSDKQTVPTGKKFGTITVIVDNMPIQVTTYRGEDRYTDYRHPDKIVFVSNIKSDLLRRDFTINAIAFNPYIQPSIIDPVNGLLDINNKLIRAVGAAPSRFIEDPLRMMRGARFISQLGFNIETETRNAIRNHAELILKVSAERIRDELNKLLLGEFPYKGLSFLIEQKIFDLIFYPLTFKIRNNKNVDSLKLVDNCPKDIVLRLAVVFNFAIIPEHITKQDTITQLIQKTLQKLRYDKQTIKHVCNVVSNLRNVTFVDEISQLTYQIKKMISKIGEEDTYRIIFIKEREMTSKNKNISLNISSVFHQILNRKDPIHLSDLAITGHDLLKLGIGKNNAKIIGTLLKIAQEWVLRWPEKNDPNYLLSRLQSIIQNNKNGHK